MICRNGVWGTSTPLFDTFGNANVSCGGRISSSSNSNATALHSTSSSDTAIDTKLILAIVGLVVGGVSVLILLARIFRRLRTPPRMRLPWTRPDPWVLPTTNDHPRFLCDDASSDLKQATPVSESHASCTTVRHGTSDSHVTSTLPLVCTPVSVSQGQHMRQPSGSSLRYFNYPRNSSSVLLIPSDHSTTSPLSSGPSRHQFDSSHSSDGSSSSMSGSSVDNLQSFLHQSPARSSPVFIVQLANEWDPERAIIVQHLDGGVVCELPPSYLDRSNIDGQAPVR